MLFGTLLTRLAQVIADTYTRNTAPVTIGCRAATRWSTRGAGCLRRARVASLDLHRQPFLLLLGLHVPLLHLLLQAILVLVEV